MIGSDLVLMGKKAGQRDSQRGDPEFLDDGAILQNGQTQGAGWEEAHSATTGFAGKI